MEPESSLVAVVLVGEADTTNGQVLGVIHLPQAQQSKPLHQFRSTVSQALPAIPQLTERQFSFLTLHGWEINEGLEDIIKTSEVITCDQAVKIRLRYQNPKFGIVIDGGPGPDIPLGFLFCDPQNTVRGLFEELSHQQPSLKQALSSSSFCFLDRNGWPIGKEQEELLTVLEIATNNTLKVRCSSRPTHHNLPARKISMQESLATDGPMELTVRARATSPSFSAGVGGGPVNAALPVPLDQTLNRPLSPIGEMAEKSELSLLEQVWGGGEGFYDSLKQGSAFGSCDYEILLSYVRSEASDIVIPLKEALISLGYSVFLDIDCIQSGVDWQDTLNDAISNCSLFVPLITMQYGETLWTNREIKLADVLGKMIIPVNFLSSWPPKCLAIQFAATQFIPWSKQETNEADDQRAITVAKNIAERYQLEMQIHVDESVTSEDSQATVIVEEIMTQEAVEPAGTPGSPAVKPRSLTVLRKPSVRKKSSIKSYASDLPESLPEEYRKEILESRAGKPLIVISCHKALRKTFVKGLIQELEERNYEVWCSADLDETDEEKAREIFQKKADEAGVVIFIISKEFAESSFCEQQVFYCEQRKRIIPLIYEPMPLPTWIAMLIGTSTFIDCKASSYKKTLLERVEAALNPHKSLKEMLTQKAKIIQMCSTVTAKLPKGKHVYISGGTRFFSSCGEQICKELGRELALDPEVILVTGGFYGVGETVGRSFYEERMRLKKAHGICHIIAERDNQDKSNQTRQNTDGTFPPVPYGETLFIGDSVRERETITPKVLNLCVLIEGGPGAAFEAQQFVWNGNHVVPVKVTGGAAGGKFNVPQNIFQKPLNVADSDWTLLGDEQAKPVEVAKAVVRITRVLLSKNVPAKKISPLHSSLRAVYKRSDTLPAWEAQTGEDSTKRQLPQSTMKRTHSEDIIKQSLSAPNSPNLELRNKK